jgi:hypothetical protein
MDGPRRDPARVSHGALAGGVPGLFDPAYAQETIQKPDHKPILDGSILFTGAYGKQVHLEPGIRFSETPGHWNVPGHPVVAPRGAAEPGWLGY